MASIADAVADGTATFKFFTTDLTTTQTGIRLDNGSARTLLEECARLGAMAMVHAEDDDLIKYMEAKLRREGRTQLGNAHLVHTNRGEELAVRAVAASGGGRRRSRLLRARLRREGAGHDRGPAGRGATGVRRGASQLPVLRARRLREAGWRQVPHRHGSAAARRLRRALAAGSPTAACRRSRPTSTRPRTRSRWPARTSSRLPAVMSASRRGA